MVEKKFNIKFNGGYGALLCTKCGAIIKIGRDFDEIEKTYINADIDSEEYKNCIKIMNGRVDNNQYLCSDCLLKLKN